MVGFADYEAKPDICRYALAIWGQERRFIDIWDERYPDNPRRTKDSDHCGDSFRLSIEDQLIYLPEGHKGCTFGGGSGGVSPAPKSDINWSKNLSRTICGFVHSEGFGGSQVQPFFRREMYGLGFWDKKSDDPNETTQCSMTARWGGTRYELKYEEPGDDNKECFRRLLSRGCKE